jgi:hypothetical protein
MVGHHYSPITVKPPINGSFPFDREGKCTFFMEKYLECIKGEIQTPSDQNTTDEKCKDLMQKYLDCRKQNDLI